MDTGATHSFVTENVLQGIKCDKKISKVILADGTLSETKSKVKLSIRFSPLL